MSTRHTKFVTLTIPAHLFNDVHLRELVDAVTMAAGGVTAHLADGQWFDAGNNKHIETVSHLKWWYKQRDEESVLDLTRLVIDRMFALGEISVMSTRQKTGTIGEEMHLHYP
jgi:hypothetical protein